ncbi:MAG: IPExxxVDY family protein [Crocinitomicaceae bacterium]
MAKHHLIIDNEFDYDLVGICSSASDYRMVWEINQTFGLELKKTEEPYKHFQKKQGVPSFHSMYEFEDDEFGIHYFLIKNKNLGAILIPEMVQIDYFVFLKNNNSHSMEEWVVKVRECETIQTAFLYEPEEIKSCENILI